MDKHYIHSISASDHHFHQFLTGYYDFLYFFMVDRTMDSSIVLSVSLLFPEIVGGQCKTDTLDEILHENDSI